MRRIVLSLPMLLLLCKAGLAASCAADLVTVQAAADAETARAAATGPALTETPAAREHHQPTPASIAAAEAANGRNKNGLAAQIALGDARAAQAKGDEAGCEAALGRASALLAVP
jgi:hypothetical protein